MNLRDKAALSILAKASEAVLLLLSSIVMVRAFPKNEYGTFLQIMLIANTVRLLTLIGLPQSIYYFFQHVIDQKRFVIRSIILSLSISAGAALFIYATQTMLAGWFNNSLLLDYGWVAPALILFRSPLYFREPILLSHGSLLLNSAITLASNVIFYVPLILAAFFSVSLRELLLITVCCSCLELCGYLGSMVWVTRRLRETSTQDASSDVSKKNVSLVEQLKYAFPIGVSSYMGIIGRQIDQYIVSMFFTPKNYAVYSRGAMQIPLISTIQFTLNNIMMPTYVSAYREGDSTTLLNSFHICIEKVAKLNFPTFAFLFAVTPSVMTFLYTQEYLDASPIFRVYLFLLLLTIAMYGSIPRASGNTTHIMFATGVNLVVNVLLSLILVFHIGPIGAAFATVASQTVSSMYLLAQTSKILHISFSKIFPWGYLAKLLLVSLFASMPIYLIEWICQPQEGTLFWVLCLDGVVYAYSYLFLLMRYSLLFPDDLDTLQKWLRFDVQKVFKAITFTS